MYDTVGVAHIPRGWAHGAGQDAGVNELESAAVGSGEHLSAAGSAHTSGGVESEDEGLRSAAHLDALDARAASSRKIMFLGAGSGCPLRRVRRTENGAVHVKRDDAIV